MEFKNEDCTFTIPDRPTVKQQLKWFGAAMGYNKEDTWIRNWEGAKQLIQTWQCDILPDYQIDLDTITDPSQREIVIFVGLETVKFMNLLEDIPKNL
jgi:hypothetical protein